MEEEKVLRIFKIGAAKFVVYGKIAVEVQHTGQKFPKIEVIKILRAIEEIQSETTTVTGEICIKQKNDRRETNTIRIKFNQVDVEEKVIAVDSGNDDDDEWT